MSDNTAEVKKAARPQLKVKAVTEETKSQANGAGHDNEPEKEVPVTGSEVKMDSLPDEVESYFARAVPVTQDTIDSMTQFSNDLMDMSSQTWDLANHNVGNLSPQTALEVGMLVMRLEGMSKAVRLDLEKLQAAVNED